MFNREAYWILHLNKKLSNGLNWKNDLLLIYYLLYILLLILNNYYILFILYLNELCLCFSTISNMFSTIS